MWLTFLSFLGVAKIILHFSTWNSHPSRRLACTFWYLVLCWNTKDRQVRILTHDLPVIFIVKTKWVSRKQCCFYKGFLTTNACFNWFPPITGCLTVSIGFKFVNFVIASVAWMRVTATWYLQFSLSRLDKNI